MLQGITTPLPGDVDQQAEGSPQPGIFGWISKIVYILISFELGMLLLLLPWFDIWENNYLLYLYPQIRPVVANPYFKGFVLGLGIVNILLGIHEIVCLRKTWKKGLFPR